VTTRSPVIGQFSAAKTVLIFLFLVAVWLAFVVMPSRQEVVKKSLSAESALTLKLRAVGLPDNSDLGGLPDIFEIWSAKAEWKDGRTKFAYWHPVTKTYAYFFEAIRTDQGIRFREIVEPHDPGYRWDESLSDDCPIRFYTSVDETIATVRAALRPIAAPLDAGHDKVAIDVTAPKIPAPLLEPVTIDSQPKR